MELPFRMEKGLIAILIVSLVYMGISGSFLSTFNGLPSPLFGGDYYYQLGQIYHMYESDFVSWFGTSNGIGTLPAYLPVYGVFVTIIGKIAFLKPLEAMLWANMVFIPLSLILFYKLLRELFDEWTAVFSIVIGIWAYLFPLFKYTEFAKLVIVPLFLWMMIRFYKEKTTKNAALFGISFGLLAISHTTGLVFASAVLAVTTLYELYPLYSKKLPSLNKLVEENKSLLVMMGIGALVSLIYWFTPLFTYHLSSGLKSYIWSFLPNQIYVGIDPILWQILDFGSIRGILFGLGMIAGAFCIIQNRIQEKQYHLPLMVWGTAMILVYSAYITMPLLNLHFAPGYIYDMYVLPSCLFIIGIGLTNIFTALDAQKRKTAGMVLLAILIMTSTFVSYDSWLNRDSFKNARNGIPPVYISLQAALLKNTNVNDVILTTNEHSFMVNALSGRKVLVSRRAHNDAFTQDFDDRQRDAAIILYGKNTQQKQELLNKYSVDYVYIDSGWGSFEFSPNGPNDPLMVFDTPQMRKDFADAGVMVAPLYWYVDPSVRASGVKMYDLLIVSPENYEETGKGLWENGIDSLLTPVWTYEQNGQTLAVLYKVNSKN